MAFPVGSDRIEEAESELGRPLPAALRERLMRDNGGEVETAGDPIWELHPVWDPGDRKRMGRTANHVVNETREAHESIGDLPEGSIVIAANVGGDLLLVLTGSDGVVRWDHETGDVEPVEVKWS